MLKKSSIASLILYFLFGLTMLTPRDSHADCVNPVGVEADIVYSSAQNVPMYCNGSQWIAMGLLNPSAGGSGCPWSPSGTKPEGHIFYNLDFHLLQYCDGDDWRAVGIGTVGENGIDNNPPTGNPKPALRAFVTSTSYDGNLGGATGADAKCQARADAASLGGTWQAIISDETTSAFERLGYGWDLLLGMNGEALARADRLWNGGIEQTGIERDEFGALVGAGNVWTGTQREGFTSVPALHCNNWTDNTNSFQGLRGSLSSTGNTWIEGGTDNCNTTLKLYCIETAVSQQIPLKKTFVTSTVYDGNLGGITGADSKCQARADAAALAGTWKALISGNATDARDRVGASWAYLVTLDNNRSSFVTELWDTAIDLSHPLRMDEFGNHILNPAGDEARVWTGTNTNGTQGTTCSDWTNGTSGNGHAGNFTKKTTNWINSSLTGCNQLFRLYCYKE